MNDFSSSYQRTVQMINVRYICKKGRILLLLLLCFQLLCSCVSSFSLILLSVFGLVITSYFTLNLVSSIWISPCVHLCLSNKLFPIFSSLPLPSAPTPLASISVMHTMGLPAVIRLFKVALSCWQQLYNRKKLKNKNKKTLINLSVYQNSNAQFSK